MRRICFLAGAALIVWLCRHYSFWALFGWIYAVASVVLIIVCFTHKRRSACKVSAAQEVPGPSQCMGFETNE